MLPALREDSERDDGFLDRLLLVYPKSYGAHQWTDSGIPEKIQTEWSAIVSALLGLRMVPDGNGERPFVVNLTTDGKAAWGEFYNKHQSSRDEQSKYPIVHAGVLVQTQGLLRSAGFGSPRTTSYLWESQDSRRG
jgi:hypothetical protein